MPAWSNLLFPHIVVVSCTLLQQKKKFVQFLNANIAHLMFVHASEYTKVQHDPDLESKVKFFFQHAIKSGFCKRESNWGMKMSQVRIVNIRRRTHMLLMCFCAHFTSYIYIFGFWIFKREIFGELGQPKGIDTFY